MHGALDISEPKIVIIVFVSSSLQYMIMCNASALKSERALCFLAHGIEVTVNKRAAV